MSGRSEILTRMSVPRPARDHSCPLGPCLKVPNPYGSEQEWERWSHQDLKSMSPEQLAAERIFAAKGKDQWHRDRLEMVRNEIRRRHGGMP